MKRLAWYGLIAAVLIFLGAPGLRADTTYNFGSPDGLNGNNMAHWIQAEPFSFSNNTDFNQVTIWAYTKPGGTFSNIITYTIYSDNSGPSGVLASAKVSADKGAGTGNLSDYTLTFSLISAFGAGANQTYWLALQNSGNCVYWETGSNVATGKQSLTGAAGSWSLSQAHAFQLSMATPTPDSVPLPSALLLFAPGLAGVALIRRRLKK